MTLLVFSGVALLIIWALLRRPQLICVALAVAFVGAVGASEVVSREHLRPALMGIDAFVIIAMWALWWAYHSERAALVATFGFLKIWFGIAAASVEMHPLLWASGNNAVFIIQVLIAGGFVDGIIAWLGRRRLVFGDRNGRLPRHLEKSPWQR